MSVCGTGARSIRLAHFLGSMVTLALSLPRRGRRTFGFQLRARICLRPSQPTAFNALFRQGAEVSLLRQDITAAGSHGMLTVSAIGLAVRLSLRARLTPG